MSRAEKLKLIKEKYPNYKEILSQDEINDLVNELDEPEKLKMFRQTGFTEQLGGAAIGGPLKGLAKLLFGTKKRAAVTGTAGFIGLGVADLMGTEGGAPAAADQQLTQEQLLQQQQDMILQDALANAQMAGVDVSALLGTSVGQQAFGANPAFNINAFLGASGMSTFGGGVFIGAGKGKETPRPGETYNQMRQRLISQPETASGTITMQEWKEQFPISDPKKLAEWKKTLVESGVVSASAGLNELKKAWEDWGQLSMDSVRMGNNLSPYQLLAIQRGLWGGGGEDKGPSYSTQLIKKTNSRELYKRAIEADTGRIISDDEADEFADLIRQKQLARPTKTEVKKVKGKKVTVTTPGFGEAEAVKIAEQRAMQDPMYKEFQTANVFGTALEKALGVRG
jgi:hypothetical protein